MRDPFAEQQEVTIRLLRLLEAAVIGAARSIVDRAETAEEELEEREEDERRSRRRRRAARRAEREDAGADTGTAPHSDDGIPWHIVRCDPPSDAFEDPATIQPGDLIDAEVIALAEPELAEPELAEPEPTEPALALPRLIPEVPADHAVQVEYRELSAKLLALADIAVEHPSETVAQRVTEVWQSFQAFNRFKTSDPELYPLIRDHLRGTIKPFCSRIIADCAEGSAR
jgi:hypothetical protein